MKRQTLADCLILCSRFCAVAKLTLEDMGKADGIYSGTKNSGALRRLSMDLTRKLAELRAGK